MKRFLCLALCALLLCGCGQADLDPGEETEQMSQTATVDVTEVTQGDVTLPNHLDETMGGTSVDLGATGAVRVTYTNPTSSVRYITSVAELPDDPALEGYDDAYFETKALLVVMETVSSGSVSVGIESVEDGVVTLSHEMNGDAGTADMATWLLWAEVEAGLEWAWSVANPAMESGGVAY